MLVTHHVEEIVPEIAQVLLLREGRVLRQGSKAEVLTGAALSEAFGMPVQVEQHGDYYAATPA
jgi:iron complex transport system ATP-binding protein